jgi:hypothetical protein
LRVSIATISQNDNEVNGIKKQEEHKYSGKIKNDCKLLFVASRHKEGMGLDGGWWDAVSPASSLTSIIAVEINIKHKDRI